MYLTEGHEGESEPRRRIYEEEEDEKLVRQVFSKVSTAFERNPKGLKSSPNVVVIEKNASRDDRTLPISTVVLPPSDSDEIPPECRGPHYMNSRITRVQFVAINTIVRPCSLHRI